jgi:hypothetical protein
VQAHANEAVAEGAAATTTEVRQPPPPPRKPKRQPPKPKLSQAALAGKESLGTFAELAAFWEAKKTDDTPPAAAHATEVEAPSAVAPPPAPEGEQPSQQPPG